MQDNPRLGIALMIATTVVFAVQDGISRYLAENYNVITVVTIRYMFFMCFVLAYSSRQKRRYPASGQQRPIAITDWAWLVTCGADMRCDLEF
jgi:drug/metabolite transporter (DMT)-like permease